MQSIFWLQQTRGCMSMIDYLFSWTSGYDGNFHLISSLIALCSGVVGLLSRKGSQLHKYTGYVFLTSMYTVNITALLKYDLTGSFNLFHFVAIASLCTLVCATYFLISFMRTKNMVDIIKHGVFMIWSYYGLFTALIAEVVTRGFPSLLHGEYGWERFSILLMCIMSVCGFITITIVRKQIAPFVRAIKHV